MTKFNNSLTQRLDIGRLIAQRARLESEIHDMGGTPPKREAWQDRGTLQGETSYNLTLLEYVESLRGTRLNFNRAS